MKRPEWMHRMPGGWRAGVAASVLVLLVAVAWGVAMAAKPASTIIGSVDLDRVATEYLQPALNEPLRQETERLQSEFDKEAAKLDQELNDKSKGASEADKQQLKSRYDQQKQELFGRYQQELDRRKQEMVNARLPKVKEAIGKVAAELGLDVVVDQGFLLWGGRDITDQVLLELGVKTAQSAKPAASGQ